MNGARLGCRNAFSLVGKDYLDLQGVGYPLSGRPIVECPYFCSMIFSKQSGGGLACLDIMIHVHTEPRGYLRRIIIKLGHQMNRK